MPMRVGTLISIQGMESLLSNHEAIDDPDCAGHLLVPTYAIICISSHSLYSRRGDSIIGIVSVLVRSCLRFCD